MLIQSEAITPGVGGVGIIKKLIKAGNLCGLEGLIGNEGAFQRAKDRCAHRGVGPRAPNHAKFRVELIRILCQWIVGVKEVATSTEGDRHIVKE